MQNKLVVIFNGPPNSGKDSIVDGIIELVGRGFSDGSEIHKMSFKDALYITTRAYVIKDLKMSFEDANDIIERCKDRNLKDEFYDLIGMTPRQLMIKVSEEVVKPKYGKGYFGKAFLERLSRLSDESEHVILVPDGGFQEEVSLINSEGIPTVVIQLHREGTSFKGDSRRYVKGLVTYGLHNDGDLDDAIISSCSIISESIEQIQQYLNSIVKMSETNKE